MKHNYFKTISSLLITGAFLFLAFGSDESKKVIARLQTKQPQLKKQKTTNAQIVMEQAIPIVTAVWTQIHQLELINVNIVTAQEKVKINHVFNTN